MSLALRLLLCFGIFAIIQGSTLEDEGRGESEGSALEDEDEGRGESEEDDAATEAEEEGDHGEDGAGEDVAEVPSLTADQLRKMHLKLDANGDGKVSLQEMMTHADTVSKSIAGKDVVNILEDIETSKDGTLSLQEYLTNLHTAGSPDEDGGEHSAEEVKKFELHKSVEEAKFKAADVNGDGKLSEDELPNLFYPETHEGVLTVAVAETMRQKDKNSDGKLTPEEFWENDHYASDPENTQSEEEIAQEKADFAKLDTNGDGSIDIKELRAWESGRFHTEDAMKKLLVMVDKNGDMHITSDEFVEARDQVAGSDAHDHLIDWADHHGLRGEL